MREKNNSDETDPFERLMGTHRRIDERLLQLERAAEDLAKGIGARAALEDAENVAHFLSRGAVRHVDDEEQTLFPRLVAIPELASILSALGEEHATHRKLEDEVRTLVGSWNGEPPTAAEAGRLKVLAERLRAVYAEHIRREEEDLFPAARRVLDPQVVAEMGREMMDRRPDRGKNK